MSVATRAPVYAIVGLDACHESITEAYLREIIVPNIQEFIDFIWAIAASWLARFVIVAEDTQTYFPQTVSRSQLPGKADCVCDWFKETESGRVHGAAITCFRTWINNTSGTPLTLTKNARYFGVLA